MRIILVVLLVGVGAFCLYGFTATYEPTQEGGQVLRRALYGAAGVACVLWVAGMLVGSVRADARRRPAPKSPPER